jgi:TonB family protein
MIQPHEDHLVWYNLQGKLPDVSPSLASRDRRPPRARNKFKQTLVAGKKDSPKDRQMIFAPQTEAPAPKPVALPNMLAVAVPRSRSFVPPVAPRITAPSPLPDAPQTPEMAVAVPKFKPALPAAPHRRFTPPKARPTAKAAVVLPEAPDASALALAVPKYKPALPAAPHRNFTPPKARPTAKAAVVLPEAPDASALAVAVPKYKPALPAAPRRNFTPPPIKRAAGAAPNLPDAPSVAASPVTGTPAYQAAVPPAPLREFTPPPSKAAASVANASAPLPDAPALPSSADKPAAPTLAVAGLDPAKLTDLPKPPASHEANFSGGPELRPKGGDGGGEATAVVVPGLLARGGSAAIPMAHPGTIPMAHPAALPRPKGLDLLHPLDGIMPSPEPHATRVSSAPDPLLEGRVIYTMAIQMPNITSFSGSWMVWFAERTTSGGKALVEPPEPLRKVDPKYIATAVAERIEGKVRLSAIIRKDGRIEDVVLLRHLDPRLDQTAEEALAKWIFQPARRGGVPIDVDAVFEIPFFLAPKPAR